MTVQFARGSRPRDEGFGGGRSRDDFQRNTRPRRTQFRMAINGLPEETSWQVCPTTPFPWSGNHFPAMFRCNFYRCMERAV